MERIERIFFLGPAALQLVWLATEGTQEIKEMKEIFVATRPQISQMRTDRTDFLCHTEIAEIAEIIVAEATTDLTDENGLHRFFMSHRKL